MLNVIAEMAMPAMEHGGVPVACPVCGQDEELILIIDGGDFSETPSFMRCDDGHQWAEPAIPRRLGAELLAGKAEDSPETFDWSAVEGDAL